MARSREAYTYLNGQKVELQKRPDQFVVRMLPDAVEKERLGETTEKVSSASTRVTCEPRELERLMSEAREVAPTHHAYERTDTGTPFLITDRIMVTFRQPLSPEEVGAFAGSYALEIVRPLSDREYLFRLTEATGMNPVKLIVQLMENEQERVAVAEHDQNYEIRMAITMPTDPSYRDQWHLHRNGAAAADYDHRSCASCEDAWRLLDHYGSADVVVGVTDDGCQLDHTDFNGPNKFASWGYFVNETLVRRGDIGASSANMYQQGANHGTSCAGVIGAETDAELTVGAAPGCTLLPIKWQSEGPSLFISSSKMVTMLDYIGTRVDVLSNSWGGAPVSEWPSNVLTRIRTLAQTGGRRGKGIVFLWAAGNENCPISHTATVDVPYDHGVDWDGGQLVWVGVSTSRSFRNNLVGIPGVMHVAALASTAQRSHYSNYGTGIGVCAPSSNSHAYYRMALPGRGITTTTGNGLTTAQFGGTSSATPLVAGIAALVIAANPSLTAVEVISILKETASKDLNLTTYARTPPASYDPTPTWDISPIAPFDRGDFINRNDPEGTWSPWFGHGRVDAVAAVRRALGRPATRLRTERIEPLAIPDADPAGISSRLSVQQSGRIESLRVEVSITHPYSGDLVVRLVAPDGQRALLHDRMGGRTQNLIRTFDSAALPELARLRGLDIRGTWSLEVADLARDDAGQLNRWALEADVVVEESARAESSPALAIPDDDPTGISDAVNVISSRNVSALQVELDITHSYIGDLRVELSHANGPRVLLHDKAGGGADNLIRAYTAGDTPGLSAFVGQPAQGVWTLHVADHAGQDVGKLNRWAVLIR